MAGWRAVEASHRDSTRGQVRETLDPAEQQADRPAGGAEDCHHQPHHPNDLHAGRLEGDARFAAEQVHHEPDRVIEIEIARHHVELLWPRALEARGDYVIAVKHVLAELFSADGFENLPAVERGLIRLGSERGREHQHLQRDRARLAQDLDLIDQPVVGSARIEWL